MIGKDKKRVVVTVSKETAADIERAAMEENRSVSNYLETLIKRHKFLYESGMLTREGEGK